MKTLSSFLMLMAACVLLTVTQTGCTGDSNAEFQPSPENTPQIPTSDRSSGSAMDEDDEAAMDNLRG